MQRIKPRGDTKLKGIEAIIDFIRQTYMGGFEDAVELCLQEIHDCLPKHQPLAFLIFDGDVCKVVDPHIEKLIGYDTEFLLGKTIDECIKLVSGKEKQKFLMERNRMRNKGHAVPELYEVVMVHKNGEDKRLVVLSKMVKFGEKDLHVIVVCEPERAIESVKHILGLVKEGKYDLMRKELGVI